MGIFDTQSAPTPPNPMATAAAQTGTNVSTAIANSYLGNVNQSTPQGNLNFDVGSNYNYTDPTTGQSFNIPRWTATQTLNPQAQQTFDATQRSQTNLAGMAEQQSGALKSLMGTPFNPAQGNFNAQQYLAQNPDVAAWVKGVTSGASPEDLAAHHYRTYGQMEGRGSGGTPAQPMGDIGLFNAVGAPQSSIGATDPFQTGYASGGNVASGYDTGGAITRDYGPQDNFSADRQRVEQSMFERVNPQLQQDEARLRQRLADQGINYGSQAFTGAYDPFNRAVTDTRLGIVQAGGQEQQRMNEMARNRAMFQNQAQQQAYGQNQALAAFGNQAQQQREAQAAARAGFFNQAAQSQFEQALGRGQFYNQAQNQMLGRQSALFNAQNQLRNQSLQEGYQQRAQPINEITALLSGSQVSQPNFINAQRSTIPTTDVAGLINQNFAQSNDLYKTGMNFWGDIAGGAIGAGGKLLASDVRVKEDIAPMGSIMSPRGELPIYEYSYKGARDDGRRHVGPMAQDVERIDPSAVKNVRGVKHIDLDRMGTIFGSA